MHKILALLFSEDDSKRGLDIIRKEFPGMMLHVDGKGMWCLHLHLDAEHAIKSSELYAVIAEGLMHANNKVRAQDN